MDAQAQTAQATDDVSLALRMMDGDEQALVTVLRLYAARVTNALRGKFRNLPEAILEDAVNRAAHTLWTKASDFDDTKGSLASLFYRCACYEVINILRDGKKAKFVSLDLIADVPVPNNPEPPTPKKIALYNDLNACIEALPPLQKAICEADLIAGCNADNAYLAQLYRTTKNSIYVSRKKARDTIRSEMKKRGHFNDRRNHG